MGILSLSLGESKGSGERKGKKKGEKKVRRERVEGEPRRIEKKGVTEEDVCARKKGTEKEGQQELH